MDQAFTTLITMKKLAAALFRLLDAPRWRDIQSAPFDRELELAVIEGDVCRVGGFCLRHGDDWLDAETLNPIKVNATHWRFRWPILLPASCC
jgi:hypothetical protein